METITMGYIGTTIRVHSFIPITQIYTLFYYSSFPYMTPTYSLIPLKIIIVANQRLVAGKS